MDEEGGSAVVDSPSVCEGDGGGTTAVRLFFSPCLVYDESGGRDPSLVYEEGYRSRGGGGVDGIGDSSLHSPSVDEKDGGAEGIGSSTRRITHVYVPGSQKRRTGGHARKEVGGHRGRVVQVARFFLAEILLVTRTRE